MVPSAVGQPVDGFIETSAAGVAMPAPLRSRWRRCAARAVARASAARWRRPARRENLTCRRARARPPR